MQSAMELLYIYDFMSYTTRGPGSSVPWSQPLLFSYYDLKKIGGNEQYQSHLEN